MSFATISGTLIDSDGTPWINAPWSAVAVSPSSPPVYEDGSPVLPVFGHLDASATFSGTIPRTDSIEPAGTTLTITIYSVTSAPPSIIESINVITPNIDLGATLSPLIAPPRVESSNLSYAYNENEILNAREGNGYVNTTSKEMFTFIGTTWVPVLPGSDEIVDADRVSAFGPSVPFDTTASNTSIGVGDVSVPVMSMFNSQAPVDEKYFDIADYPGGVQFRYGDDSAGNLIPWLIADRSGSGTTTGTIFLQSQDTHVAGGLKVYGPDTTDFSQTNVAMQTTQQTPAVSFIGLAGGPDTKYADIVSFPGGMQFRFTNDAQTTVSTALSLGRNAGNATIAIFASDVTVTGDFTVDGTKNFRTPYPLDPSKYLFHACLEGPENGVFYRGEGRTYKGSAEITLPDYFEALTRPEGRSVQLTEIFEDDSDAVIASNHFATLMASRVKNGQFSVRASFPIVKFYWEVKAVRADIAPLEVVTEKAEAP